MSRRRTSLANGSQRDVPPSLFWGRVRVEQEESFSPELANSLKKRTSNSVLLIGAARRALARMPDEVFQCCVTSPPYWSLRNYHIEGQIGLEPSLNDYIASLVECFARSIGSFARTAHFGSTSATPTPPGGRTWRAPDKK